MAKLSPAELRSLRHLPSYGGNSDDDALAGAYRAGRVSLRFTAERGLEYLGTEASRIFDDRQRRR